MNFSSFKKEIWAHYKKSRRSFPWREHIDPYHVVVSEVMLQQTQADRVVAKFENFIARFPSFDALASASPTAVLKEWQGLGYNRRGLNLKRLSEIIVNVHGGTVPNMTAELELLPGIGPNTAGSILAFAHNIPHPFIETNIRTVYIHFFFKGRADVTDSEIMPLVIKTLDIENPRDWYYALMDYGVMLKKLHKNPSRRSSHHRKQSAFAGSNRELRSLILKAVLEDPGVSIATLRRRSKISSHPLTKKSFAKNVDDLIGEGFLSSKEGALYIST